MVFILVTACSKTHTGRSCAGWAGQYTYNEDPVPTSTGINRIMLWDLNITEQGDTCWGELEITGLRTYVKLLTVLSGDSSHVNVIYNKYLDGEEEFREGDVLFSLSKENNKLITTWHTMQPRLSEYADEAGVCFRFKKKRKGEQG
jgi:hypothetical protein